MLLVSRSLRSNHRGIVALSQAKTETKTALSHTMIMRTFCLRNASITATSALSSEMIV